MVHAGINKNLSNESIVEMYDASMKGMENYYLFNPQLFKNELEKQSLTDLVQPPIHVALNKDTIYDCISAITKVYQKEPQS